MPLRRSLGHSGSGKVAKARDIQKILEFVSPCGEEHHLVVHCRAGIARSPATAYAVLCQAEGPGRERECLRQIFALRPMAEPDPGIVRIADGLLQRGGAMVAEYEQWMRTKRAEGVTEDAGKSNAAASRSKRVTIEEARSQFRRHNPSHDKDRDRPMPTEKALRYRAEICKRKPGNPLP